jgi:iron complex outermembrane receptor protein
MGFTLDGIPLGDMSYGNNNGLHISRAIASENIGRVNLSQGSGSLGVASTSNLGGTVQFFSADPENKMGARLDQTMGSSSMIRTYARLDTGLLESGTKGYFSYANQSAEKWKGWGPQRQEQFNSKLVHMWGDSKVSAFLNTSDRMETDYQDMSIDMQQKLGWGWDNFAPDWKSAINAANAYNNSVHNALIDAGKITGSKLPVVYPGNIGSINANTGQVDAAYYLGRGLRKDKLMGTSLDLGLSDDLRFKSTLYNHTNAGQGHWYTPYQASPGTAAAPGVYTGEGLPISIRTTEYSIRRNGWINDLTWVSGINTVNGGLWYEKSLSTLARNFYAATGPTITDSFLSNPFSTGFVQDFTTTTTQLYLQDSMALMDGKLKANVGFKSPKVQIDAVSQSGSRAAGSLTAKKTLLPQLGANYILSDATEVFASASQNMRAYQPGVNGPFSQTQAGFDAIKDTLKPELSESYEVGYRYKGDAMQGSVAAYLTNFHDRLLSVGSTGIVGNPSVFANVGKVQSTGVEAALIWAVAQNWNWFNSLTLNNSQYKSDYMDGSTLVKINGKQVVDAPKVMFSTDLGYDKNGWYGNLNAKYTGERYYTYTNDNKVDAFLLMNASAGYKQKNVAGMKEVALQVAITNLMDKKYFSTIGSNGFIASDTQGAFATMLEGAPRQVFVTLSGKF